MSDQEMGVGFPHRAGGIDPGCHCVSPLIVVFAFVLKGFRPGDAIFISRGAAGTPGALALRASARPPSVNSGGVPIPRVVILTQGGPALLLGLLELCM